MLKHILPLIPEHKCYIEPFCGGASVFFAKPPAKVSILNDKNNEVVNFYKVLRNPRLRERLYTKLRATPYARSVFLEAIDTFFHPERKSKVARAWALFTGCGQAFGGMLCNRWSVSYSKKDRSGTFHRKVMMLRMQELRRLISETQLENRDACKIIRSAKNEDCFIYADPPYIDSEQSHYSGYGHADYEQLLQTLEQTPAKFMLSSYPSELLERYRKRNNWIQKEFVMPLSAGTYSRKTPGKKKTEVLTMNYKI